jgi:hypothetical protein
LSLKPTRLPLTSFGILFLLIPHKELDACFPFPVSALLVAAEPLRLCPSRPCSLHPSTSRGRTTIHPVPVSKFTLPDPIVDRIAFVSHVHYRSRWVGGRLRSGLSKMIATVLCMLVSYNQSRSNTDALLEHFSNAKAAFSKKLTNCPYYVPSMSQSSSLATTRSSTNFRREISMKH